MSPAGDPRPEAIQAVIDMIVDQDFAAEARIGHITSAERAAGEQAAAEVLKAQQADRANWLQVMEILVDGGYRAGMTWTEAWDIQDEEHRSAIARRFEAVPDPLVELVRRWREERSL